MSHEHQEAQIEANSAAILDSKAGDEIVYAARMIGMNLIKMAQDGNPVALPVCIFKGFSNEGAAPVFIKISIAHSMDELE